MKLRPQIKDGAKGHQFFQFLAMFSGTLSITCSGMHYGWPSPSLPQLQHPNSTIPVTNQEGSWMAVMPLIGATIGSIAGSFILDIIGRKKSVLLTSFPFFISWVMVAYANSVPVLLTARFIAGIADGLAFCSVPMYLGEIADPSIRGIIGSSCSITWVFGMFLINVIGSYTGISVAAGISSAIPVLLFVTFMWMPESPYFLIMKRRFDEARNSLRTFRGVHDVENELNRLRLAVEEDTHRTGKFLDLFRVKSNRKAVFIIMGTRATQQLSGTMAITFYAKTIFHNAGDDISSSTAAIIYFAVQLIVSSVSSIIVDKTGRRPLLMISVTGAGILLFIEGLYFQLRTIPELNLEKFSIIPVVALIMFVIVFSSGLQAIPILFLGELFPMNVKAFALALADIYFTVLATAISKFFQIVKDDHGIQVPFFVFSGCCMLGLIFIIFFVPETKGKTLEEIQMELRGITNYQSDKQTQEALFKNNEGKC